MQKFQNLDRAEALKAHREFCKAMDEIEDEPIDEDWFRVMNMGLRFNKEEEA
jgi:hypothetical protein